MDKFLFFLAGLFTYRAIDLFLYPYVDEEFEDEENL